MKNRPAESVRVRRELKKAGEESSFSENAARCSLSDPISIHQRHRRPRLCFCCACFREESNAGQEIAFGGLRPSFNLRSAVSFGKITALQYFQEMQQILMYHEN